MLRSATVAVLAVLLVSLVSCDTQLTRDLDQTNPNDLVEERYFENAEQLETAVNATYSNFQVTRMYKRRKFFVYDALSGVIAPTAAAESWIPAMIGWNHGAGNSGISLHWEGLYQGIHRANLVIEKADEVPDISSSVRDELVAQARFLRAFHYYKLVALWGDVPLIEEVKREPGGESLATADDIYSFIEDDLEFAINNLPSSWDGDNVGRATSVAAEALWGRMELDRGSYGSAQDHFENVVNNGEAPGGGSLQLVDDYFDNYSEETENNDESIFEIQFAEGTGNDWFYQGGNGSNQTFRNQEYGFLQWRNVVASESVMDEMNVDGTDRVSDVDDERAASTWYFACETYNSGQNVYTTASVDSTACGIDAEDHNVGDDIPSWKKYQVYYREQREGFVANSGVNFREIRYAEVLLGLAEAHIQQGNLGQAADYIDDVRTTHTSLSGYGSFSSEDEAMDALYHENVMEFTGDSALYHFLKRNPSYLEQLNSDAFSPYLMPVPRNEIDNNPEIDEGVNADRGY